MGGHTIVRRATSYQIPSLAIRLASMRTLNARLAPVGQCYTLGYNCVEQTVSHTFELGGHTVASGTTSYQVSTLTETPTRPSMPHRCTRTLLQSEMGVPAYPRGQGLTEDPQSGGGRRDEWGERRGLQLVEHPPPSIVLLSTLPIFSHHPISISPWLPCRWPPA